MTYEQWVEQYRPITNQLVESAPFDNTMFETTGVELWFINNCDGKKIWTLAEYEGQQLVLAGHRVVNRLGYFITEVPWESENIEIELLDAEERLELALSSFFGDATDTVTIDGNDRVQWHGKDFDHPTFGLGCVVLTFDVKAPQTAMVQFNTQNGDWYGLWDDMAKRFA